MCQKQGDDLSHPKLIYKRTFSMKGRLTLLSLFCALHFVPAFSQSWDEVKRNSAVYLYGEGSGATVEEADRKALADLVSKISVVVSSDFVLTEDEMSTDTGFDAKAYAHSKVETYSTATLTNTERLDLGSTADEARIGRYVKRSELNRIFEGRRRTIREYVRLGDVAEAAGKVDDALRNYYWAFSLLKSVQHPAEVTDTDDDGHERQLLTWLPERINGIFGDMDVRVARNDGTNVDLEFTYRGRPVSSVDFTYFDGRDWSNLSSVKNGIGTMEFAQNMVPNTVQINYEYAYRGQTHINPEIKTVMGVVKGHALRRSRVSLPVADGRTDYADGRAAGFVAGGGPVVRRDETATASAAAISEVALAEAEEQPYRRTLDRVMTAIRTRRYDDALSCFTADGQDMYRRLVSYGNARLVGSTGGYRLYRYRDNVVARSIPMSFSFRQGLRKNFVEDIVFTFDASGKIDCLAFALDAKAKEDILGKIVWPVQARQALMEFLENYKTAYALKRLDYLRDIFSDDCVIIVGHVARRMERVPGTDGVRFSSNKYVNRVRYTKEEYMRNLANCFRSNEFVNIRFANNDVRKARNGQVYGIQIKQDYYSSNYGDQGYLYLQVDIENPKQPIIMVRTWQAEPDPEVGLFGMGHF